MTLPLSHSIMACDEDRIVRLARELHTTEETIEDTIMSLDGETSLILDAIELLGWDDIEALVVYLGIEEPEDLQQYEEAV